MFWFPKKKIVLDCFTDDPAVFDFAQPKHAASAMPQWWKDLPKDVESPGHLQRMPTVKRCPGVHDMVKHSIAVPMWCDLAVELGPIGTTHYRYQFSGSGAPMVEHPPPQRGEYLPNTHYQHIKIVSLWKFKCKEEIPWMLTQATWAFEHPDEVFIPPAVMDFKHQADVNFNAFFTRKPEAYVQNIPYAQPMIYVTPLSDRGVDMRTHLVTKDELETMSRGARIKFLNNYQTIRKVTAANESKCPFGFGG